MATYDSLSFPIGASDPLAEEIWSQKTHVETQYETFFAKKGMVAEDKGDEESHKKVAGSPVVSKSEFGKQAGQVLNQRLRLQLTRTPRNATYGCYTHGSTDVLGNEEALTYYDCQIWLDKLKNMVGFDAPDINQHRTSIDLEADVREALKSWLVENVEEIFIDGLVDGAAYHAIQDTSASAVTHPNQYYVEGASSQETMDDTKTLNSRELRRMRAFCNRVNSAGLNPVPIDGERAYVVLASSNVCNDLLQDEEFQTVVSRAAVRGHANPLVSGSIGKFYNLYIHEYDRARSVSSGTNADNIEEVFILGSNALAIGYGSEPRFLVRHEDTYGDRWGRGIAQILGIGRADWADSSNTTLLNQSSGNWRVWRDSDEWD